MFETETLESPTGAQLALYVARAETSGEMAKAVIHINHGMAEHSARYERFARHLNSAGYHVVAHDHRGHGNTSAPDAPQGQFAASGGFDKVIADVDAVNAHIRQTFPDLPIILFGHSMGSIIGLNYCIRHSDKIAAAALWNSGVDGGVLLKIYGFLLAVERMFKGSDVPSSIAAKLTFETWNKTFAPNRTTHDWLSRDDVQVDKYIADPLCGLDCTNSLWRDLLTGIMAGGDDGQIANIRPDLPMHLLAGGKDPCTDNGKAVERLHARLEKAGIADLTLALHAYNRHEALNELNWDEVISQFIQWLESRFGQGQG